MPRGKVKWFNNAKGYGFIIEDGCSDDLFAHFSSVQMDGYKTLKAGQAVTFEKKPSDKGIHAVNIIPVPVTEDSGTGDVATEKARPTEAEETASGDRSPQAMNA